MGTDHRERQMSALIEDKPSIECISEHVFLIKGAVNTSVVIYNRHAVLFNCSDSVNEEMLCSLGIAKVDMVFCTSYRRIANAGIYTYSRRGAEIVVPAKEAYLFTGTDSYWLDLKYRWHIYQFTPDSEVLPVSVDRVFPVSEGSILRWQGFGITVLDTPGNTFGGVSYIISVDGGRLCFCGDLVMDDGRIRNLWQTSSSTDKLDGYHGFMESRHDLFASLRKIAEQSTILVPIYGDVISDIDRVVHMLDVRMERLYRSYAAVSSMNYYFDNMLLEEMNSLEGMERSDTFDPPPFVRYVGVPCYLIVSDDGSSFLIDCGFDSLIEKIQCWIKDGIVNSVDCCWITHYHDDHVNVLDKVVEAFHCEIYASDCMSDIIEHPHRWFLPCISPTAVNAISIADGVTWEWKEFSFTAFRFPGQTLHHGGLLVEGHGMKLFFAGDTFSPTGIDDYCAQNRNFLGKGRGMIRCIDILRKYKPNCIIAQHQERAFCFTDAQLDYMEKNLLARIEFISNLTTWPAVDFTLDEWWARTYPYQQDAIRGDTISIEMRFTNHSFDMLAVMAEPVLPDGWIWLTDGNLALLPPRTCGLSGSAFGNPDIAIPIRILIPADSERKLYCLPIRIKFNDTYLGWYRHTLVRVV
jgi:glyoxylase-like metal-dependent hydrolase (beta-lactamase superfamily II)